MCQLCQQEISESSKPELPHDLHQTFELEIDSKSF